MKQKPSWDSFVSQLWIIAVIGLLGIGIQMTPLIPAKVAAIDPTEYRYLRDTFVHITETQNPKVALEEVRTQSLYDRRVLRSCHALVHEIGHAAYKKYGSVAEALAYQDEICGAGYTHGVIEAYVEDVGYTADTLKALCNPYKDKERQNCYHGVGHGLMDFNNNDVQIATSVCNEMPTADDRVRCAEGVFMERFDHDDAHDTGERDANLFTPCLARSEIYQKGACYFYAPLGYLKIHPGHYQDMFATCQSAESDFIPTCIKGTASRMTKDNTYDIKVLARICDTQKESLACMEGIGSYLFTQYGDVEKVRAVCSSFKEKYQKACLKAEESKS